MRKGEWINALIGAAVSVMTTAVVGIFGKVSDLAETSAANQVRLGQLETERLSMKEDIGRLAETSDNTRLEVAKMKVTWDDWARKISHQIRGG